MLAGIRPCACVKCGLLVCKPKEREKKKEKRKKKKKKRTRYASICARQESR